jgi:NADPH:quinone reductase-like Zn-dependent oxidoreductase
MSLCRQSFSVIKYVSGRNVMRYFCIEKELGIDALQLKEKPVSRPGPGQVLVRIRAASLNYRDLLVVEGSYTRNLPLPLIPLSDGAGEVVEVGAGVSRWKPGDRVAGTFFQDWEGGEITEDATKSALGGAINGVLAEHALLSERGLVRIPAHLSFEEGATLPCAALTAWHALRSGNLTCGQSVLTLGTGGVSLFAQAFARASGARIIATTGSDAKAERLRGMGISEVINYKKEPDWEKGVWELTGKHGVDLVVEVGGAGTLGKSLKAVRLGGHISLIGVLSGTTGEVNPLPAVMKKVRVQGIYVGSREMFEAMNQAIELHGIHPIIDRVFPFEETKEAYHYLKSGVHFGKVVIAV